MRFLICVVLISCSMFIGCEKDGAANPSNDANKTENNGVVNYGNGVFYFSEDDDAFGDSLSQFIRDNPELEIVAMADNSRGPGGYSMGHWVVFRKKRAGER